MANDANDRASQPDEGQSGVHRLRDIVVEEVSLVDRAANKRRFLVVKRSEGMAKMNDDDDEKDEESEESDDAEDEDAEKARGDGDGEDEDGEDDGEDKDAEKARGGAG